MNALEIRRRDFAEEIRKTVGVHTESLVDAFATVPRERFLGNGPWLIEVSGGYRKTPNDDPIHLYANVRVALDPDRELNNGRPFVHAEWMDQLDIRAGDHVVHIGAGTGYYSAILAMAVGSTGRVTAIEVDPILARQLQENLSDFPQVETVQASGTDYPFEPADVIYVNAGATHPAQNWLDRLRPGGRMILPLAEMGSNRYGGMLWIKRESEGYAARFLSSLRIYPCAGARDERAEALLAEAFERGGYEEVRSLRRVRHKREPECWLHGEGYCLSCRPPETSG